MKTFFEKIERELNNAIYMLAEQNFTEAVISIRSIQKKTRETLEKGIFYCKGEELTKAEIIEKYPTVEIALNSEIGNIAEKSETPEEAKEFIEKSERLPFYVTKGINLTSGRISEIAVAFDENLADEIITFVL
ncbi:MAG: hypothetical protein ACYCUW_01650 [bacterium]